MSNSTRSTSSPLPNLPSSSSKKRKRPPSTLAELSVDINAPVPPSKKALRKAKKTKPALPFEPKSTTTKSNHQEEDERETLETTTASKRSDHGIWIGNLPWSATKADVRQFLTANTTITDAVITRLHLPSPREGASHVPSRPYIPKPQNKGFAYVDFATSTALAQALTLTETLLTGRRVLIKDSKSFDGRPEKTSLKEGGGDAADAQTTAYTGKPPSKRVFVGNLGFETSEEDLRSHFERCGAVAGVHVATFEDSGKCKGFAWVEFEELEAGKAAVRGWVDFVEEEKNGDEVENEDDEDEEEASGKENELSHSSPKLKPSKKRKPRKWWVNKLKGRPLRMEFAEDKAVRYKKRYGKDSTVRKAEGHPVPPTSSPSTPTTATIVMATTTAVHQKPAPHSSKKKFDPRTIAPGAALAAVPRLTGGIVASEGRKTTFA